MMENTGQLLDYLATHPDAKMRFYGCNMILNVHSDASYLSIFGTKSQACRHFLFGWMPKDNKPIKLNSGFYAHSIILKFVVASAAEAELVTIFF